MWTLTVAEWQMTNGNDNASDEKNPIEPKSTMLQYDRLN